MSQRDEEDNNEQLGDMGNTERGAEESWQATFEAYDDRGG
jgi:hypothetical protein